MNNPYQPTQIANIVNATLGEILGRDPSELRATDSLTDDLGAESLDFVELAYALERRLNLTLPKKSILDHATAKLGSGQVVGARGGVTTLGVFLLQNSFFRFSGDQVSVGMLPIEIMGATTIANWTSICHQLFEYLPDRCGACGGDSALVATSGKVVCGACHGLLAPPPGDEVLSAYVGDLLQAWHEPPQSLAGGVR